MFNKRTSARIHARVELDYARRMGITKFHALALVEALDTKEFSSLAFSSLEKAVEMAARDCGWVREGDDFVDTNPLPPVDKPEHEDF